MSVSTESDLSSLSVLYPSPFGRGQGEGAKPSDWIKGQFLIHAGL